MQIQLKKLIKSYSFVWVFLLPHFNVLAQEEEGVQMVVTQVPLERTGKPHLTAVGLGLGLDYGGCGANFTVFPHKNIGLFLGAGFNTVGLGYNLGVKLRLTKKETDWKWVPYLLGMYGYHTAIQINYNDKLCRTFYGNTVGIGLDYKPKGMKYNYWSFSLVVPIRSQEVTNYVNELNRYGELVNYYYPVGITIGHKLGI